MTGSRGAAARTEAVLAEGDEALSDGICRQLWIEPQINFDGAVLGCCVNTWGSFGENAFEVGLKRALGKKAMEIEILQAARDEVKKRPRFYGVSKR